MVGEIPITLIHTPGHTPGSQCFLVEGRLVAGDTLFLDGCGRTDLPGSDPEQMYLSLTQRLAQVPDDAVLYPGHLYSEKPAAGMAEVRQRNVVFRPDSLEQWLMMFGSVEPRFAVGCSSSLARWRSLRSVELVVLTAALTSPRAGGLVPRPQARVSGVTPSGRAGRRGDRAMPSAAPGVRPSPGGSRGTLRSWERWRRAASE